MAIRKLKVRVVVQHMIHMIMKLKIVFRNIPDLC